MTKRKPTIDKTSKKQTKGKRVSMTIDDGLVAIFYKLPQNEYDYECAINGVAYRRVLLDLDASLRSVVKYGDNKVDVKHAEFWRKELLELLKEEGIEL